MRIEVVTDPGPAWDEFVLSCPGATLGHASAWARVFSEAYRLEPHYLTAVASGGEIRGILPLVCMKGLRGRRELVSLPFLDTAGVLAADSTAEKALRHDAMERVARLGADALELRALAAASSPPGPLDRVDLVLRLESDADAQWSALRAKVRNQTRKAEREGLALIERRGDAQIDAFYGPFAINMRDLGSPVHARRFFTAIAHAFGERVRFIVTGLGETPVGGLVAIAHGDTVSIPWASTLRSERHRCPNNQIYWEGLRWAIEQGASALDFGRSPRSGGTHRFKIGWGGEERELDWERFRPDGPSIPLSAPGANPMLQRLSKAWMRLPVGVATRLGPLVRRRLSS